MKPLISACAAKGIGERGVTQAEIDEITKAARAEMAQAVEAARAARSACHSAKAETLQYLVGGIPAITICCYCERCRL